MREQPGRLVFIDETSVTTKMTRLRGRSRKGERLKAHAPFLAIGGLRPFIAALRCDGLSAPWIIDKAHEPRAPSIPISRPSLRRRCPKVTSSFSTTWLFTRAQRLPSAFARKERGFSSCPPYSPRSESDRNGLCKTQGPFENRSRQNLRRPVEGYRQHMRSLDLPGKSGERTGLYTASWRAMLSNWIGLM